MQEWTSSIDQDSTQMNLLESGLYHELSVEWSAWLLRCKKDVASCIMIIEM